MKLNTPSIVHGFDLLRSAVFLAIMIFHFSWALFAYDPYPRPDLTPNWLTQPAYYYAQMLTLGGHVILCLSSLLFGLRLRPFAERMRTWLGLLAAWLAFAGFLHLREGGSFHLAWDVYPLVALGWSSSYLLIFRSRRAAFITLCFSLLLLSQSFWEWPLFTKLPLYGQEVLVGRCPEDYADWPVLPWIGLVWASVAVGYLLRFVKDFSLRARELPLWLGVVLVFCHYYEPHYYIDLGDAFACALFRRSLAVRGAQLALLALILRIALIPEVQGALQRRAFIRWLSTLACNRRFYLAYFIHYMLIFCFFALQEFFVLYGAQWFYALALGSLPFLTEITTRVVGKHPLSLFALFLRRK